MRDRVVLRHINDIREAKDGDRLGRLPVAVPTMTTDCVFARAFRDIDPSVTVYVDHIVTDDLAFANIIAAEFGTKVILIEGRPAAKLPNAVKGWIREFDAEQRAHLIDGPAYDAAKRKGLIAA